MIPVKQIHGFRQEADKIRQLRVQTFHIVNLRQKVGNYYPLVNSNDDTLEIEQQLNYVEQTPM